MKIGINLLLWTGHVTDALRPVLETIAATGFGGVELPIFDASDPGHYRRLSVLLDELNLRRTVSTAFTQPGLNPISDDADERAAAKSFAAQVAACASELGAELVVGPLFQQLGLFTGAGPSETELSRCATFLTDYAAVMNRHGLIGAVEPLNRFEAHLLNSCEQAAAMMDRVADPAIGILFDTFHAHIEERDPVAALAGLLDRDQLAHIHISENDRGIPGRGHARIREAIHLLTARGYDGWLTIEAFGKAVPELAAATRVWRDFFANPLDVVTGGYAYIRACLADQATSASR